jgi:hypothetical protein
MKAVCPKNRKHKRFITVAHVTEDWVVDEHGDFIAVHEASETEVVHKPHPDNTWTCAECGAQATVRTE